MGEIVHRFTRTAAVLLALLTCDAARADKTPNVVQSVKSGRWSDRATWKDNRAPAAGDKVLVRADHTVIYDVKSSAVIRSLHVAGVVRFATDRDTRLDVGLIRIHAGEDLSEEGFEPGPHVDKASKRSSAPPSGNVECLCCQGKAALLVGTPEQPISAKHVALIRLHYVPGMDKKSCPAVVCCGGRMDFHGAPIRHTWCKLGARAEAGDKRIVAAERLADWKVGDHVIVTGSYGNFGGRAPQTEERTITALDGSRMTLNEPLTFSHRGEGELRAEVANLSRNVIVESADPNGNRGHVMYHVGSSGSVSYAEFRHLGKRDVLGRYAVHYHLCKDTMRGSSIVGASVWDSDNRWVTVHGTEYVIVRDCVGYKSIGHGFFLEDGTETHNVFDHNLAVRADAGRPLAEQALPFDKNEGAGFWWANSHNTFTRNVAVDCAGYGFRYEAAPTFGSPRRRFNLSLPVLQPDGSRAERDVRTLPFVRFDDNEAHNIGNYGLNLGEDAAGVGPDKDHPFVLRNVKIWNAQRAYTVHVPNVRIDGMLIHRCGYEIYRARYVAQDYRDVRLSGIRGSGYVSNVDEYLTTGRLVKEPGVGLSRARLPGYPRGTGAGGTAYREASVETAMLKPIDDAPPATVITRVTVEGANLRVRGVASDDGTVKRVIVNGNNARAIAPNFAEWEVILKVKPKSVLTLTAHAEDDAANVEKTKHKLRIALP